jgi:hypothetical protein
MTAWVSRNGSMPPAAWAEALELAVGVADGRHLRVRAVLVGVRVVVGQGEQHEVAQVVGDEVRPDAARVLVARPGSPSVAVQPVSWEAKMSA